MKIRILIFSLIITPYIFGNADLVLLDQIEAVVYGQEDVEIITKSDIDRPSLGGGFRTKEEIIFEKEVYLDAQKHKIPQDDEAVDAYLAQVQREHNLSEKDVEMIFTSAGYTVEEGREQLKVMQVVSTMLDVKIRSNLIVSRKDVEQYYNEHPEIIEATYTLERMFVPQSKKMSADAQYKFLVKSIALAAKKKTELIVDGGEWGDSFTLNHSDIAPSKQFIYTMKIGAISSPERVQGGFELFRLVAKTDEHIKSLEESYREIVDILRRPKYEELMENYRQFLQDHSSVVYFSA